jgi:hypothetical protein
MNDILKNYKINPNNVKELLKKDNNQDHQSNQPKKKNIWDDIGDLQRYRNKMRRIRTNEIYNDEYFAQFHGGKKKDEQIVVKPEVVQEEEKQLAVS